MNMQTSTPQGTRLELCRWLVDNRRLYRLDPPEIWDCEGAAIHTFYSRCRDKPFWDQGMNRRTKILDWEIT